MGIYFAATEPLMKPFVFWRGSVNPTFIIFFTGDLFGERLPSYHGSESDKQVKGIVRGVERGRDKERTPTLFLAPHFLRFMLSSFFLRRFGIGTFAGVGKIDAGRQINGLERRA